jgi:anti-sigma B factor antagonist
VDVEVVDGDGGVATMRLTGRLDLVSAAGLRSAVEGAVEAGRPRLVVDLSGVAFVDSSGLGALVAGLKRARQAGGELRIAAAGEQVMTVLTLTRLVRVLRPYATVDEALDGL